MRPRHTHPWQEDSFISQIIACKSPNGIILGADSGGFALDGSGALETIKVRRLRQLTSHTAILAGGGAESEGMIDALAAFLAGETAVDIDEVYSASLPFLASAFEAFMRQSCASLPLDPIHHVYFIVAGYSRHHDAFRLLLIWNRKRRPHLDGDEIETVYAVPRHMGFEYRLKRQAVDGCPLDELLAQVRTDFYRREAKPEDFSAPFRFATITREGYRELSE